MSDVPIFVSTPSKLNHRQQAVYDAIAQTMREARLRPCTVRSALPLQSPLTDVYKLARQCAGGLILGFRQAQSARLKRWPDTRFETEVAEAAYHPSPWNQLEAGILYSLGRPLLVLAEDGVGGGIFDTGAAGHVVHMLNVEAFDEAEEQRMCGLVAGWSLKIVGLRREVSLLR